MTQERLIWVDWMKVIGIYFIIVGHLYPDENALVYAFNVPLFFIISGYLDKRSSDIKSFFKKQTKRLIIPLLIIFVINFLIDMFFAIRRETYTNEILYRPFYALMGYVFYNGLTVLRACWFIYTLFFLKLLHQLVNDIRLLALLFLVFAGITIWQKYNVEVSNPNSILNICVCYPFFLIGIIAKNLPSLPVFKQWVCVFLMLLFGIITVICSNYNGTPWMWLNEYGNYFLLFILEGICGSLTIYFASVLLSKWDVKNNLLTTISNGTIVILGFHQVLLQVYPHLHIEMNAFKYIYSFVVLLVFVPIILLSKKYFPIILGGR